MVRNSSVCFRY